MKNAEVLNPNKNKANAYFVKEIMDSTPPQLLLKVYDFAIAHCQRENVEKSNRAVSELINSLNFDDEEAKDISVELLRLYQFVQDSTRKGEFDVSIKILSELRNTWTQVFEKVSLTPNLTN